MNRVKLLVGLGLAASTLAIAAPANAVFLTNGTTGIAPTPGLPAGQGTLLASQSMTGTALTFQATFNQAVYLNTAGTLDFYYQVIRLGPGEASNDEIRSFTVANFGGYTVDAYAMGGDPDGAGFFLAANNPFLDDGVTASGPTTTFGRSLSGGVLTAEFGLNGLSRTENSATYIYRTNATAYNNLGTFGVIDGSTFPGRTFQPTAPVPEPASWALMIGGFGLVGGAIRARRKQATLALA